MFGCDRHHRPCSPVRLFRQQRDREDRRQLAHHGFARPQAEPDREPLRLDDRMDVGCKPSSGTSEITISIPLFPVEACWWARTDLLSILSMATAADARNPFRIRCHRQASRNHILAENSASKHLARSSSCHQMGSRSSTTSKDAGSPSAGTKIRGREKSRSSGSCRRLWCTGRATGGSVRRLP